MSKLIMLFTLPLLLLLATSGLSVPLVNPATTTTMTTATPSSQNVNSVAQQQRNVDKELRLESIRKYVLTMLGEGKAPSTPFENPLNMGNNKPQAPKATQFSGEIKTFYPSCEIPARTDKRVWTDPESFHLFFKFPLDYNNGTSNSTRNGNNASHQPIATSRPSTTIISAKLRLYKIGVGENAQQPHYETPAASEPCNNTEGSGSVENAVIPSAIPTEFGGEMPLADEKIRVSLYAYMTPRSRYHLTKKMLATEMISAKESRWVEFDIKSTVGKWIDNNAQNFGLVVQVENEYNEWLNPSTYFTGLACPGNNSNSTVLQVSPPQIEVCILNMPSNMRSPKRREPTNPTGMSEMSESFRLLSQVNNDHLQQRARNSGHQTELQNDDVSTNSEHRHRHRHGEGKKQNKKNRNNPTTPLPTFGRFQLDEDHPFRRIFATTPAASSNSRQHHNQHRFPHFETSDYSEGDDDRDIIIQKIYIRAPEAGSLNR